MRVYRVKGNTPIGKIDLEISRSEIINMKKQIVADGKVGYSEMLRIMSHPAAIIRYQMIPGTRELRWLLNTCIIFRWCLIIAVIFLLIKQHWWWALICAIIHYLINSLQTSLNYEIGARLFVLDQKLGEWENEKKEVD